MAVGYGTPAGTGVQEPPVVAELHALFARLNDADLLSALQGPTRRGPRGYSPRVLWRCFVAKYALGLPSTVAMVRTLTNNPFVAEACGVSWPNGIPSEATFSRFYRRLASQRVLPRLKDVSRALVRECYASLPGFGRLVALDSTTLKGWSNGGKIPKADRHAGWSVKLGTQGVKEAVYGWKCHLLVDAEYELPIAANISAGNVHDQKRASNVLSEARFTYSKFRPRYLMADQGYSGAPLDHLIRRQYLATPIILQNRSHKKRKARAAQFESTPAFKALLKQRQSVERAFSRLKGQRSLNSITVRGRWKVTAHCYLSLIALQAWECQSDLAPQ